MANFYCWVGGKEPCFPKNTLSIFLSSCTWKKDFIVIGGKVFKVLIYVVCKIILIFFFSTVKPTVIDVDIYVNSIGPVSSINMVSGLLTKIFIWVAHLGISTNFWKRQ